MDTSTASSSTWNCPSSPRTCSCCSPMVSGYRAALSMVVPRDKRATLADQEIEVRALVGLQYVIEIELPVASGERCFRFLPFLFSPLNLAGRNQKVQFPLRDIEFNDVAVLDQRQHAACGCLRRSVQHDRAVGRSAHARIRDAHHVRDALLEEHGR